MARVNHGARPVAIEGLDGSGKETQTKLLRDALAARGLDARPISFPRYGKPSAALVEAYLGEIFGSSADSVNVCGASNFFAMDRFASCLLEWKNTCKSSDVLFADRYVTGNAIHQCSNLPCCEWGGFVDRLFDYESASSRSQGPSGSSTCARLEVSQGLIEQRRLAGDCERNIHERGAGSLARSQEAADWYARRCGWEVIEYSDARRMYPVEEIHAKIIDKVGV